MAESNRTRTNGPALEKMYQFLLWLVPTVDKMPRAHKFTLGDRIQKPHWMCWKISLKQPTNPAASKLAMESCTPCGKRSAAGTG